jgi:ribose transport system substrate-binding protein
MALALALGLSGTVPAADQRTFIPLIARGFQHQFWQSVKKGAEQAAQDYKVTISFEAPEAEWMVDKQIDMLAAGLARRPGAIGLAATDSQAVIPLLRKAKAAKVPVVAFDSGVSGDLTATTVMTDNAAAAGLAADKLAALLGDAGDVLLLAHDQVSTTGVLRRDGFLDQMRKAHPKIRVIEVQYAADPLKAAEVARAMVQAHPRAKGLFCTNEATALGAGKAMKEIRKSGLVVVGFDSGKGQKDLINEGVMAGAITQNPVGIGYKTVEAAVKLSRGEGVPKVIDTGYFWYDKSSMRDPRIAPLLYD